MILEVIGESDRALTPTEMNETLELPKQTIHRLVTSLVAEGFLIKEKNKNRYRPSRRLRMIGTGLLYASRSNVVRHQILTQVAKEVNEAVNFVVPEESGMKYLDRVETNWPFRIQLPRGSNVPFHATASGKTFMASLSSAARKKFVHSLELTACTEQTFIDPEKLLKELKLVSKQGYSTDNEEFLQGMVAVSVPVIDEKGRFVAALATHGPSDRLSLNDAEEISQQLKKYSQKLGEAIFMEDVD